MAREFVNNGAVMVNGDKVTDTEATIQKVDALFSRYTLVKRGKRLFNLFIWK